MVNEITRCGLIVTQAGGTSALLNELIAICDWPVILQPSARLLFQQIDMSRPICLVFWLDAGCDIAPAARLVGRLRDRGPRPYRIVIAHRLEDGIEHIFRSAGVHSYFSTSGNISALVEDALLPLFDPQRVAATEHRGHTAEAPVAIRGLTDVRGSPASIRPP